MTTGYGALQGAGFITAGDNTDGPAFICRIDDEPPPSQDPCVTTPPASAYWSYWHADAGQNTWTFSEQGAMSYHPLPGSVDTWTFGAGRPPPIPPKAVMATAPDPAGTGPSTTTSVPAATAAGHGEPAARGGSSPNIVDVAGAPIRKQNNGSPVAFIIGAAVVAVAVAGGGIAAWRRRQIP